MTAEWQDRAACREADPEIFFTPRRVDEAVRFCATCPVVLACRAAGVGAYRGVWGGQQVHASTPGPSPASPYIEQHGTNAAYQRHCQRGERPCERCTVAHTYARRDREAATA